MPISPKQAASQSTALSESLVKAHEEIFYGALAASYGAYDLAGLDEHGR